MRNPLRQPRGPASPRPTWPSRRMARPRRLASLPAVWVVGAGILMGLLLTQLVALANSVVNLRREIMDLQTEKAYLEASNALSMSEWIHMTGKETIMRRAETELGLIPPDGPGPVLVMTDQARERDKSAWQRILDTVGGNASPVSPVSAQDTWP